MTATVEPAATASQLAPTTATTTDTAESASQEVQQHKAEVVELKADIERLKAEVVEPNKLMGVPIDDVWHLDAEKQLDPRSTALQNLCESRAHALRHAYQQWPRKTKPQSSR